MTKEPKLEAAVRIVPEWQDYDQEIKQLQIRFQEEKAAAAQGEEPAKEPHADGKLAWLQEGLLRSSGFWWLQTQQNSGLCPDAVQCVPHSLPQSHLQTGVVTRSHCLFFPFFEEGCFPCVII